MPLIALTNHLARGDVQSREQRSRSVPLIIVRLLLRQPRTQRKNRSRSVQSLYRGLLIHGQHNRVVRRVHVQAHDIPYLLHKERIRGQFEVLAAVRLQPESVPDSYHGALRQANSWARVHVLKWIAATAVLSSVRVTASSTCASVIWRGAPARGSSHKPSKRASKNRLRHLPAVAPVIPNCSAILRRRANIPSFSSSSARKVRGFSGRPVRMLVLPVWRSEISIGGQVADLFNEFMTQDTSLRVHGNRLLSARCSGFRPVTNMTTGCA